MGRQERGCEYEADRCCTMELGSEDFVIGKDECEIRVDIVTERVRQVVVIWGYVKDCGGCPVSGALVKLQQHGCRPQELRGIAHTFTDCKGYYQFDLMGDCGGKFRVVASKSACGREHEGKDCHHPPQTCDPCGPVRERDWGRSGTPQRMPDVGDEDGSKPKNKIYYY